MQPTTVTLTLPTANTDGTPIAAGELVDVEVGYGSTSAGGNPSFTYANVVDEVLSAVDPTATPTVTFPWSDVTSAALPVGVTYIAVRMKTAAGTVSAWSSEAQWTVAAPVPNPPTGFSVA